MLYHSKIVGTGKPVWDNATHWQKGYTNPSSTRFRLKVEKLVEGEVVGKKDEIDVNMDKVGIDG